MKYSLRVTNTSTNCRMLGCFTLATGRGANLSLRTGQTPERLYLHCGPWQTGQRLVLLEATCPCNPSLLPHMPPHTPKPHTHILRMPISFLAAFRTLRPSRFWNFLQVCSLPVVLSLARKISQNSSL